MSSKYKYIFAAGGTGGHLFPAVAVAQKILELKPEADILFIGTKNKIEAMAVPALGFKFKTIWISGFSRQFSVKNFLFPLKVIVAYVQSFFINLSFKPKVIVGAGAYVSGPVISAGSTLGAKIMLLEQNNFPGVTNRLLEKKADVIHVSFEDSKNYFRESRKIIVSGNPVRVDFNLMNKSEAIEKYGLDKTKKTLLIIGGSLGAQSINEAVADNIEFFKQKNIQLIWQTGKIYYERFKYLESNTIKIYDFIADMNSAYSAGDLILARAGSSTIFEAALLSLAVVFVPSKYVAANHQYHNAKVIKESGAGDLILDDEIKKELSSKVEELIFDEEKLEDLRTNIKKFAKPNAALEIAQNAIDLAEGKQAAV